MKVTRQAPCKVNLILNILGRREDGFHELETIMQPVGILDELTLVPSTEMALTCSASDVPADRTNLVWRAAELFFEHTGIQDRAQIHLEKRIPSAAGLGGGSSDAAQTLLGLSELFGANIPLTELELLAGKLGSDIPFFLHSGPALAVGRGERVEVLPKFAGLQGAAFVLVKPEFGVPTAWAYKALAGHPADLNGRPGRAFALAECLGKRAALEQTEISTLFYNSLEAPVFAKYPLLALITRSMRVGGARVSLMSGSGSTVFAICDCRPSAEELAIKLRLEFGEKMWIAVVDV